jgi:hypothetical protein
LDAQGVEVAKRATVEDRQLEVLFGPRLGVDPGPSNRVEFPKLQAGVIASVAITCSITVV